MYNNGSILKFTYDGRSRMVRVENNPKRMNLITGYVINEAGNPIKSFNPAYMLGTVVIK